MDRRDHGEMTPGPSAVDRAAATETEEKAGTLAVLPDDVLADILRRLPPRGLAASRCVRAAWRDIVDARRLLRADLLPLSLGGIFINFHNYYISEFFSCPSTAGRPYISGKHNYLPEPGSRSWGRVYDHCNGLVLVDAFDDDGICWHYVLNPATRLVARLPPPPPPPMSGMDTYRDMHLMYDPAVSPDYDVVSVTHLLYKEFREYPKGSRNKDDRDPAVEQSEWPPLVCTLQVFSSRTGQWEERSFAREGDCAGTIADMRNELREQRNAVYWRGALYIHCQTDFIMRISLSSDKYHVIVKPPEETSRHFYLGKSAKGVYCASMAGRCRVQVWYLDESGPKMEWVLKHDRDLRKCLLKHRIEYRRPDCGYGPAVRGPWTLQDINCYYDEHHRDTDCYYDEFNKDNSMEAPVQEEFECSSQVSDDEKSACNSDDGYHEYMDILGFHPFEEIIFLGESIIRGLAYHFSSSKIEVLGNIYPAAYGLELGNEQLIRSTFPYTPCWL